MEAKFSVLKVVHESLSHHLCVELHAEKLSLLAGLHLQHFFHVVFGGEPHLDINLAFVVLYCHFNFKLINKLMKQVA